MYDSLAGSYSQTMTELVSVAVVLQLSFWMEHLFHSVSQQKIHCEKLKWSEILRQFLRPKGTYMVRRCQGEPAGHKPKTR